MPNQPLAVLLKIPAVALPHGNMKLNMKFRLSNKKKLLLIPVLISAVSLIYIFSLTQTPPPITTVSPNISPTPIQATNPLLKDKTAPEIIFTNPQPLFPDTLSTYSIKPSSLTPTTWADKFVLFFDLLPSPENPNNWISLTTFSTLTLNLPNSSLVYQVDSFQKPLLYSGSYPTSKSDAIKSATLFVSKFSELSNLTPNENSIGYLKGSGQTLPASAANYSLIEIPFDQNIDTLPIRFSDRTTPSLVLTYGQNNQLIKLVFSPKSLISSYSILKKYPVVPLDQAKIALENNQATLINLSADQINLQTLPLITINKISLEYRLGENQTVLIPYYRFDGTFVNSETTTPSLITYIYPAIKL